MKYIGINVIISVPINYKLLDTCIIIFIKGEYLWGKRDFQ